MEDLLINPKEVQFSGMLDVSYFNPSSLQGFLGGILAGLVVLATKLEA